MTVTVLTLRGTGEVVDNPTNMLSNVTQLLDPTKYQLGADVDYPASIGPVNPLNNPLGVSEAESIAQGVTITAAAIRATPNLVGLIGYSLGAEVVSAFLEAQAQGQYSDCQLAWAAFVANPRRAPGEDIDTGSIGYGIAGAHGRYPAHTPIFNAANPQDGITSCPADSPLRTLSDQVTNLTFVDNTWTADLLNRFVTGNWQPTDPNWWLHPAQEFELYDNAIALLEGYLAGGQHTTSYINGGYCARLAQLLNGLPV